MQLSQSLLTQDKLVESTTMKSSKLMWLTEILNKKYCHFTPEKTLGMVAAV